MSLTTIGWTGTPLRAELVLKRAVRLDGNEVLPAGTYPIGHVLPGFTFNPWLGCMKISEACDGCYAEELVTGRMGYSLTSNDPRRRLKVWGPAAASERVKTSAENWKRPLRWNRVAQELGVRLKVFCASLADVFEDNPQVQPWRQELFELIERTGDLDWLLLTKRPGVVTRTVPASWRNDLGGRWPSHVWLGATVENNKRAFERVPYLCDVPGVPVRFLSVEPLEDPAFDLAPFLRAQWVCSECGELTEDSDADVCARCGDREGGWINRRLNWVIVGGRSGSGRTPLPLPAVEKLVADCDAFKTTVFVKQDSGPRPGMRGRLSDELWARKGFPQ